MFSKIKQAKPPLSLSSVSNAIKNSGAASLTPEITAKNLAAVAGDQIGLPLDLVLAVAYDPVQSLLALSTTRASVHVYGQHSVEVVFELKTLGDIVHLAFVKGVYLVCVELSGNVTVLSLHSKQVLGTYLAPGGVSAVASDPTLDWVVLGLLNGLLLFYDVDRLALAPLRIDNLQKLVLPKCRLSPVLRVEWHPRDVGTLLVTYSHSAIQYSVTQGSVKNAFFYQLTPDCRGFEHSNTFETGGKKKLFGLAKDVLVRMRRASYHPNGLHVATAHDDGTLAFWDANDATLLQARTLSQCNLHQAGPPVQLAAAGDINFRWITGQDPEITLLVVSGWSADKPHVLDVLDFGLTLKYSLTSHEKQTDFYARPSNGCFQIPVKFNRRLQDRGALEYIVTMCPLAADAQPYFNGGHNPSRALVITNFGGLHIVPLRKDAPPPTLPPSMASVVPPTTYSHVMSARRADWFGILNRNPAPGAIVNGGAPVSRHFPRSLGSDEGQKDILVSGHEDGTVRCLDVTSGEHSGEERRLEFSVKDTLDAGRDSSFYRVARVSASFEARHVLVGVANGNVAICRYGKVPGPVVQPTLQGYELCPTLHSDEDVSIVDLSRRISGDFSQQTFVPVSLLKLPEPDKITALSMSNTGFAAVGYKSGRLVVCDITRGPAVILNLPNVTKHLPSVTDECFVTALEFAIMEYGQDGYSSLLLFAGTNAGGNLLSFKIVPQGNGAFMAAFADKTLGLIYKSSDNSRAMGITKIMPVNSATGQSAVATMDMFQRLAQNLLIPGYVVVGSAKDFRVLKTAKQKLSHKVIDVSCAASGVINFRNKGAALAVLTSTGYIKLLSLPALSDVADVKPPSAVFERVQAALKLGQAIGSEVLYSGEIFLRLSPSELLQLFVYDTSKNKTFKEKPTDLLFNETAIIPPRPTAGAILWAAGHYQHISTKDLALLIAGPNRKPAKNLESQLAYNISPEANPNQSYGTSYGLSSGKKDEPAYAEPVRKSAAANPYGVSTLRFVQGLRDGLDYVEESVNNYANGMSESMNETVDSGKKTFYTLALKSKFGF